MSQSQVGDRIGVMRIKSRRVGERASRWLVVTLAEQHHAEVVVVRRFAAVERNRAANRIHGLAGFSHLQVGQSENVPRPGMRGVVAENLLTGRDGAGQIVRTETAQGVAKRMVHKKWSDRHGHG